MSVDPFRNGAAKMSFEYASMLGVLISVTACGCSAVDSQLVDTDEIPPAVEEDASTDEDTDEPVPVELVPGTPVREIEVELPESGLGRIVAIGDLHGDMTATRSALMLAGAIDDTDAWIGGELIVVQVGDQLDRGDEDRAVFDLFDRLAVEAGQTGGRVISLSGNHEVMNVDGWMDYVTPGGYLAFGDLSGLDLEAPWLAAFPAHERPRRAAFHPGEIYALRTAERSIVVKIGETIFTHGGILPSHVEYGLSRINEEVAGWMRGQNPPPEGTTSSGGPVWSNEYSASPDAYDCAELKAVLESLSSERMVVGHVLQSSGISPACDDKIWRIDTGMAEYYGGTVQVLEIVGDQVNVLKGPALFSDGLFYSNHPAPESMSISVPESRPASLPASWSVSVSESVSESLSTSMS